MPGPEPRPILSARTPKTTPTGQFASQLSPEALSQRQFSAYKMRLAGASFDDIGRALKIDRRTASRDVAAVHTDLRTETLEDIESLRQQQTARLDIALFAIMPEVKKGKLFAVDRLLAIEKRRAELLGLDAPRRVEMTGKDGGALETSISIRERWTPQEAAEKTEEIIRRLKVAQRETARIDKADLADENLKAVKAQPQDGDERN